MTARLVLGVIAAIMTLLPTSSRACKRRHQTPFEVYDAAQVVAHVRVASVPPPGRIKNRPGIGEAALAAVHHWKGALPRKKPSPPPTLITRLDGTSCDLALAVGDEAVIFLDEHGVPEGARDGYLRDVAAWKPVLDAWSRAADNAARMTVLVDAATGSAAAVRREAVAFLLDEPALVAAIDAAARARLVAQLTADREPDLALLLVRLRDPAAVDVLPKHDALARAIATALTYETEHDPAKLARAIRTARQPADRWAAFERCERVRGVALARFSRYVQNVGRTPAVALATACRDGTPLDE